MTPPSPSSTTGLPDPWPAPRAEGPVEAVVTLPGSKSLTNRALVLASIAGGPSVVRRALRSRDTELMAAADVLVANAALVGQASAEKQQDCKSRGLQTASLIVLLRGTELSKAIQGAYQGTLNILIAAQ